MLPIRLVALIAGVGLAAVTADAAAATTEPCRAKGRVCFLLTVPLDRSHVVPGTVRLRVERRRATRPTRPPLLVLGGAAGVSSRASVSYTVDGLLAAEGRSRDVVAMDLRGTGRSGALRCRALDRPALSPSAAAAAACAASLGSRRGFFTAHDSAQDIEAVRVALGAEKIALLGSSYGAQVAFAYAQRHPDRVDRLVLASSPGPTGFDALYRSGLAAVPDALQVLCRKNRCQHASDDPLADLTTVARRLDRGPLIGTLIDPFGRPRRARLDAFDLFMALRHAGNGDRDFVGHLRSAARGDLRPLLRRYRQPDPWSAQDVDLTRFGASPWFSPAARAASMCEESMLPWSRDADLSERRRLTAAFVDGLPEGSLFPLGRRAALGSDILDLCQRWPMASRAPDPPRPLPPIPALIVTSVDDVLAPVSSARAVAELIPGARLLRLRGGGHDIFTTGVGSSCAEQVLSDFLVGVMPEDVCGPEHKSYRGASPPPPASLADLSPDPRVGGRAGRTLTAVNATIRDGGEDVQRQVLLRVATLRDRTPRQARRLLSRPVRTGGLRHGSYAYSLPRGRLVLREASYVPGVRVSGWVTFAQEPGRRRGVLRVAGPGAERGTLVLRRGSMTGRLGGRSVGAPARWGPDLGF